MNALKTLNDNLVRLNEGLERSFAYEHDVNMRLHALTGLKLAVIEAGVDALNEMMIGPLPAPPGE